jgi:hypothetical protein
MAIPVSTVDTLSYKEILASDVFIKLGVTVSAGQGKIEVGTVLGKITASGKYGKYDNTATDGREVAKCIAAESCDTTDSDKAIAAYFMGAFNEDKLVGLDDAAKADMTACVFI